MSNFSTNLDDYHHIDQLRSHFTEEQLCRLEYLAERISLLGSDPNINEAIELCSRIIKKKLMDIDAIVIMSHDKHHILAGIVIETQIALVNLFIDLRDIVVDKPTNATMN